MENPKRGRASPWFVFSALCSFALIAVIAVCMVMIGTTNSVVPNPRGQPLVAEQEQDAYPFPQVDWDYWKSVNPDVVAWVTVPGTAIDYAVVQAPAHNPAYYLDHDIYRNWNPHGCPYVDVDCEALTSPNTVIFGHNMGYGDSMFSDFARYSSEGYAQEHVLILLQSPDEKVALTVSAADVVNGAEQSKVTEFGGIEELNTWYAKRLDAADVKLVDEPHITRLVTFVTCSYNYWSNERTLIYSFPENERNTLWQIC